MDFRLKNLNKDSSWIRKVLTYFFNKEKYLVVIPYAKFLKEKINEKYIFDYSSPRSRRDVKRLLALNLCYDLAFIKNKEKLKNIRVINF